METNEKSMIEMLFFEQFKNLTLGRNTASCSWQFVNYCKWTGVI